MPEHSEHSEHEQRPATDEPTMAASATQEVADAATDPIDAAIDAQLEGEIDGDITALIDADIVEVMRQRDEYLDALRRVQADFENYRKRILREQTAHLERAAEGLVEQLLPVLDAFQLA